MDEKRYEEIRQQAKDEMAAQIENMQAAVSDMPYFILADELHRRGGFLVHPVGP